MADDKNLATLKVTVTADKYIADPGDAAENQENNVLCFFKGNGKRLSDKIRDKGSNAGVSGASGGSRPGKRCFG